MERQKECFKCNISKPISQFYKHNQMGDGHVNKCKDCNKKENKENWWKRRDEKILYDRSRYRYSEDRMIKHKYKGIKDRCEGKHRGRIYTVTGMKYLSFNSFLNWWEKNKTEYDRCYEIWRDSGFQNKFAPSIDRIDPRKGYVSKNMQWLLHTENCSKYNKVPLHLQ